MKHVIIALAPVALTLVVAHATTARADTATANAAFKQAEELVKAGKWSEACPFYESSYKADPQLGALLYLAECHDHVGKTATAWAEFNDAIDLARSKGDPREDRIRKRADALLPKLAKLRVDLATKSPDEKVTRDGSDMTVLVGTDVPIDPGEHELVASAPGYTEWRQKITIEPAKPSAISIPALVKIVVAVVTPPIVKPVVHEGTVEIRTQPDALITLDGKAVGSDGHFRGTLSSTGGHTLRVVAAHMRPFQSDLTVGDGQERIVDVPLERDMIGAAFAPAPHEDLPSFELGASVASGVKFREDKPLVVATRVELALRFGRRVNFGLFVDYGQIDTNNACGYDAAGPTPATPFDFGQRNSFTKCSYVMPGLQLLVHVLPAGKIDPYLGIAPGFRFGFTEWNASLGGMDLGHQSVTMPAIVTGLRGGVNYHPTRAMPGLQVGAFVEGSITVFGDEAANDSGDQGRGVHFLTMFGGLRSTVEF